MKEYKVGDTIYVKDTVTDIDYGDSTATYYGKYHGWFDNSCIIDGLPADPVKPVLPKEVADEISFAKFIGVTFDRYIVRELTRSDYKDAATYTMIHSPDVLNSIEVLLNAWNNGYTVEKPKRYVLPMPGTGYHNYQMHGNAQYYAVKGSGGNWRADLIALDTDDAVKNGYIVTQSDLDAAPDWVKAITPVEVNDEQ